MTDELALLVADDFALGRRVAEDLLAVDEPLRVALAAVLSGSLPATA